MDQGIIVHNLVVMWPITVQLLDGITINVLMVTVIGQKSKAEGF